MTLRRQFGSGLLALILGAGLTGTALAQRQDHGGNRPQQQSRPEPRANAPRQQNSAPREQRQQNSAPREQRQQARQQERQPGAGSQVQRPYSGTANGNRGNTNAERQTANPYRPNGGRANSEAGMVNRQGVNPNRPPTSQNNGSYRNGPQAATRLSPEERQRVLQNQQRFRQLSPQQQQDMRDRSRVWQQMTPQQREHVQNDVLPTWRSMPPQRQRAISQRLGVLQNMPESARIQHLSDPNFTRGMSDEDRATLRDLSHLHVGGAPDPPRE